MTECKDLGLKRLLWQSTITADISLAMLKDIEHKLDQEKWGNCGIIAPHIEEQDKQKSREKLIKFLDTNKGKKGLISIKCIAEELCLTEDFVLSTLHEFGMDVTEEL